MYFFLLAGRDFAKVRYTSSVHLPFSTFDVSTGLCECVDIVRDRVVERTEYFDLHLQSTHPLVRTTDSRVFVRDNPIGRFIIKCLPRQHTLMKMAICDFNLFLV